MKNNENCIHAKCISISISISISKKWKAFSCHMQQKYYVVLSYKNDIIHDAKVHLINTFASEQEINDSFHLENMKNLTH